MYVCIIAHLCTYGTHTHTYIVQMKKCCLICGNMRFVCAACHAVVGPLQAATATNKSELIERQPAANSYGEAAATLGAVHRRRLWPQSVRWRWASCCCSCVVCCRTHGKFINGQRKGMSHQWNSVGSNNELLSVHVCMCEYWMDSYYTNTYIYILVYTQRFLFACVAPTPTELCHPPAKVAGVCVEGLKLRLHK